METSSCAEPASGGRLPPAATPVPLGLGARIAALLRRVGAASDPEPGRRYPVPVTDEEGCIVALRWPCGHESDPSEDRCPTCAVALRQSPT